MIVPAEVGCTSIRSISWSVTDLCKVRSDHVHLANQPQFQAGVVGGWGIARRELPLYRLWSTSTGTISLDLPYDTCQWQDDSRGVAARRLPDKHISDKFTSNRGSAVKPQVYEKATANLW